MKTVKIYIQDVQETKNGGIVLIAKPNEINPKSGNITFDEAGAERLIKRCIGFNGRKSFANYVRLSNGSAVLSVEVTAHEPGDSFTDARTGETGTHKGSKALDKDGNVIYTTYFAKNNWEVKLGLVAEMKLSDKMVELEFQQSLLGNVALAPKAIAIQEEQAPTT